jgi:hypothetical protein
MRSDEHAPDFVEVQPRLVFIAEVVRVATYVCFKDDCFGGKFDLVGGRVTALFVYAPYAYGLHLLSDGEKNVLKIEE